MAAPSKLTALSLLLLSACYATDPRDLGEAEQPIINGNGRQTRDFVFVDDVVEANLAVMGKDVQGVYNVGTAEETTVNELFRLLVELTNAGCKELHGPAKKGEQVRSVVDISRLRQELGWEPRVPLREGLKRTVEFFRERAS